jgi:hypothetical protein
MQDYSVEVAGRKTVQSLTGLFAELDFRGPEFSVQTPSGAGRRFPHMI